MGSGFRTRCLFVARAGLIALALTTAAPASAHADLWCWLFDSGCGGGSSGNAAQQSAPGRSTPEIDPGTLVGAIALAAGGAALMNDRVRRRRR